MLLWLGRAGGDTRRWQMTRQVLVGCRLHARQVCVQLLTDDATAGSREQPKCPLTHLGLCCCLCPELSLLGLVLTLLGHLLLPREVDHLCQRDSMKCSRYHQRVCVIWHGWCACTRWALLVVGGAHPASTVGSLHLPALHAATS